MGEQQVCLQQQLSRRQSVQAVARLHLLSLQASTLSITSDA